MIQLLANKLIWVSVFLAFFPSQMIAKRVKQKVFQNRIFVEILDLIIRILITGLVFVLIRWAIS